VSSASALRRWARRGLVGAALLMVTALMATVWASYSNVRSATETLSWGQGISLLHGLERALHGADGPPTDTDLEEVIAADAEAGLRYLGLFTPDGRLIAQAGEPQGGTESVEADLADQEPRQVLTRGGRARMILHRPGPRPGGRPGPGPGPRPGVRPGPRPGPPPHGSPPHGFPGDRHPPHHQPVLVIEFEPLVANELRSDAVRTLGIGAASAVILMLVSLVLLRWLLRREAMERQLERDRRLAGLGEMSAVLAHEMRNPLTSLKGHAQLLTETLPADSRDHAKAERVVTEAQRLERLTGDLLEFVRSGEIAREPCDPAALLRESASAIDESRIEVSAESSPDSWSLDGERMRQVLTNLLRNAVQASPADARVEATVGATGGALEYVVRDRGDGIPTGEEERIFEPFHTKRTRGTGLGLAVARRIVELHGGTLRASNHPQGGALFRVSIPED